MIYLITIHYNFNENLNVALLYIPAPKNGINDMNLVY